MRITISLKFFATNLFIKSDSA